MRDEIIKGMVIGLVCVVIVVGIGSFIGSSLSHGPEPQGEPAAESEQGAADGEVIKDSPEAGDTTSGKGTAE